MADFIYWVGMAAIAVNALTAVIEAERKAFDLLGAIIIAMACALGGGTLRDLLLDRSVFWIKDATYLATAIAFGIMSFVILKRRKMSPQAFLIPDAVGLALFTAIGTQIALNQGISWLPASVLGVITGAVGGVLRDLLCNEVPLILRRSELYATAAWLGALALILAQTQGLTAIEAGWLGMGVVLTLRLLAIRFRLTLPTLERKT